jgi:hypothetical protein
MVISTVDLPPTLIPTHIAIADTVMLPDDAVDAIPGSSGARGTECLPS